MDIPQRAMGKVSRTRHRGDVDGLRAIAVLPILLFHAGVTVLPGGFIGVDVFFVISGFLITNIIDVQIKAGTFSILDFYRRRAVRIFPALFVLIAATLAAAIMLLLPYEVSEVARSAAASAAFLSNVFFWRTSDYFAAAANTRPLLHTWSLGIEEQFYLFYPALLLILRRWLPANLLSTLWVLTALSFAVALWLADHSPSAGFYLIPSRAWELGLGGIVALGGFPRVTSAFGRHLLSLAGLSLIIGGILMIGEDWSFPAPWAVLPCLGSALVIAYGETAASARLLSLPVLRGIGAISYSLYLWHWPIITLYRLRKGMLLSPGETLFLLAASFAAAIISYFLVEQPFLRTFRSRGRSSRLVTVSTLALVGVVSGCLWIAAHAPRLGKVNPATERVLAYLDYPNWPGMRKRMRGSICFSATGVEGYDPETCLRSRPDRRNVLLIGDSTAAHYSEPIRSRYPTVNLLQATASGCLPLRNGLGKPSCVAVVKAGFDKAMSGDVQEVIIAGLWDEGALGPLVPTVQSLRARGVAVLVIGPPIMWDNPFPKILARAILQKELDGVDAYRTTRYDTLDAQMRGAMLRVGARYVSPRAMVCPHEKCLTLTRNGEPAFFDAVHYTFPGAHEIFARFPSL